MNLLPFFLIFSVIACQSTRSRHNLIGNEYARDGLLKEAVGAYYLALRENPNNYAAHRNLGLLLVKMGKYDRAIKHLKKCLYRYKNDFDTNFFLGEAYRSKGKLAEAIFRYRSAINIKPNAPEALKSLGWTYFKINLFSEAKRTINKLLAIDRNDVNGVIILARIYYKQGDYQKTFKIINKYRDRVSPNTLSYFQGIEGNIHMELGRVKVATKLYLAALRSNPLLPGALIGLGKAFLLRKQHEKAARYLERAARLRPKFSEVHLLLGEAYELTDKKKSLRHYQIYHTLGKQQREPARRLAAIKTKIELLKKITR